MTNPKIFLCGGAVRDLVFGVEPSDFDYVMEASDFEALIKFSKDAGFRGLPGAKTDSGFHEEPHHLGLKAICPVLNKVVDIHCARKEFNYSDGNHPDIVKPGTLLEDSCRRDFTMNSLLLERGCYDVSKIVDINKGLKDIEDGILRSVGAAFARFHENPDRIIRAFRFAVKYNLLFSHDIERAFYNPVLIERLAKENDDRKMKSLNKILKDKSNYREFFSLLHLFCDLQDAMFSNVGLEATNKKTFAS